MKTFRKLVVLVVCWLFTSLSANVFSQTAIELSSPGTLKDVAGIDTVTQLTLTGAIDARDVAFMRDSMTNLAELDLGGVIVAEYEGDGGTVSGYAAYSAGKIPEYSFYDGSAAMTSLTAVVLPGGLVAIGDYAFYGCTGLNSIINMNLLPANINSNVFEGVNKSACELKVPTSALEAYMAAEVWNDFSSVVGGGVVFNAKANDIALGSITGTPNGFYTEGATVSLTATPVEGYNFIGWRSEEIYISTELTLSFALTSDTVITAVFGNANSVHLTVAGTLEDVTGLTNITHLTITGNIDIRDIAFMRNNISNLVELDLSGATIMEYDGSGDWWNFYPANEIPRYSFSGNTSLTSVILPQGLTSIGTEAFTGCSNLTNIDFNAGLTSIGVDAFAGCSNLTTVNLPVGLSSLDGGAFAGCNKLFSINLPAGLTNIGPRSFFGCTNLTVVNLPVGLNFIGYYAFGGCYNLTSINFPVGLFSIDYEAFIGCFNLTSITFPDGLTYIGNSAFANCNLTDITFPDGLRSIGNSAFERCTNLTSITFPNSLTSIGNSAFANCSNLTDIDFNTGLTSIGEYAFFNCSNLTNIFNAGLTSIGDGAFADCSNLSSINLLAGLTSIGFGAFADCSNLTTVNLPVGLISLGGSAFSECINLTSVNLPVGLTSLGRGAFAGCSSLTSINIPAGVTTIEQSTFYRCSNLSTVILPAGVTYINDYAFSGCSGLTELTNMNPQPINIQSSVFEGVDKSTCELTVPTSSRAAYQAADVWKDFSPIIGGGWVFSASVNNITFGKVIGTPNGLYPADTLVSLTAIADTGYVFVEWRSGTTAISSDSTINITLTNDTMIIAVFGKTENINLTSAGTLKDVQGITDITHLTITGNIDARDIKFMRDSISYLVELDLSGATIVAYHGTEGTYPWKNYSYPANEMPEQSFCFFKRVAAESKGKTSLISIILPNGLTSIGKNAFTHCDNLTAIGFPVGLSSIGDEAFSYCNSLISIDLPNGLSSIGNYAFSYCNKLYSLNLPDGLTSIGNSAFSYCNNLTAVNLPVGLISIGQYAFFNCINLSSINFSDGLISIGNSAFEHCSNLTSIDLPVGLTSLGEEVFYECVNLSSINLPVGLDSIKYRAFYGCSSLTSIDLPEGLTYIGISAFSHCSNLTSTDIPESLISIDNTAFLECGKLTSINIPDGLTSIGEGAFESCRSLTSIIIPAGVTSIKDNVFALCNNLSSITLPVGLTSIGNHAFAGCNSLTSIDLPTDLTTIGSSAFSGCSNLASIDIPVGVISIGGSAFRDCDILTSITVPVGVTSIEGFVFSGCNSLSSVTIPVGVISIGGSAFRDCNILTSITIPAGVTSIGSYAFSGCKSLTSIDIPARVTSIGYSAFAGCNSLNTATLPAELTYIGENAFSNCSGLTELTNMNPQPLNINSTVFAYIDKSKCELIVPTSSLEAYKSAEVWKDFSPITAGGLLFSANVNNIAYGSITGAPSGLYSADTSVNLTAIADTGYTFIEWRSGTTVISSDSTINITLTNDTVIIAVFGKTNNINLTSAGTLKDVAGIKDITHLTITGKIDARDVAFIRDSILNLVELDLSGAMIVEYTGDEGTYSGNYSYPANEMPERSFYFYRSIGLGTGKTSLTSVILPSGLTSIGIDAFHLCTNLSAIDIPVGVTAIKNSAFAECSISFVNLPVGLIAIEDKAFTKCSNLTTIDLPDGLTSIGNSAFSVCSNLMTIDFPVGLIAIGGEAFSGCSNLTTINLPVGVTSIGGGAFSGCRNLTTINLPVGLTSIGIGAFSYCSNLTTINLPVGLTSIGAGAFSYCSSLVSIDIPVGVTSITGVMFDHCENLASINLPTGLTSIGNSAFYGCSNLTTIDFPVGLTSIGDYAFSGCGSLSSVAFSVGLTSIGNHAFVGCNSLSSVTLPVGLTSIGNSAFSGCDNLTSINFPVGLTSIGNRAFYGCSGLTSIDLPVGVISIEERTFAYCNNLSIVNLPVGLTSIGTSAFFGCGSLASINFPAGLTSIGYDAFSGCSSLTSINIPAGVTTIEQFAFFNCDNLNTVILPAGVTYIGDYAFAGCVGLTSLTNMNPRPINIHSDVFEGVDKSVCELTVPTDSRAAYQSAEVWKEFSKITAGGVLFSAMANDIAYGRVTGTSNGLYPLNTTVNLTAVSGAGYMFVEWRSGTTVLSGNSTISFALAADTMLTAVFAVATADSITVAGTLKDIVGIKNVKHLTIAGVIDARDIAFIRDSITNLVGLDLSGATIVEYSGFGGTYPDSRLYPANAMPDLSFYNSATSTGKGSLASVILPDSLSSIGKEAFRSCDNLSSITIPAGVTSIGDSAFFDCAGLSFVINHNPVPVTLDSSVFVGVNQPDCTLEVPSNSVRAYRSAEVWKEFYIDGPEDYEIRLFAEHGSATGGGRYNIADSARLVATPDAGYEFTGWSIEGLTISTDTVFIFKLSEHNITDNTVISANFRTIDYSIAYELNGGINNAGNPATYTVENVVALQAPTKTGYEFAGWAEGNTIAKGSTGDKTFTAQWNIIHYSIAYELNGGVNNPANGTTYTVEDRVILNVPTKTGYEFAGWVEGDSIAKGSIGDKTFTAQWDIIRYAITYELNGGANHSDNPATYTVHDTVVLQTLDRRGYDFAGWYPDNRIDGGSTGDKTFTAQWNIIHYSITYELNGGVNNPANGTTYTVEDRVILNAPTKAGYEFAGWVEGDTIPAGSIGDRTFTAQWSEITTFNITYELNGGANHADNPATYTIEDLVVLKAPTKRGYDFAGWQEGGVVAKGSTGDKTFTAQWTAIVYRITYELNGGVNHPANDTVYTVEDSIAIKAPSKTGYNFVGWQGGDTIIVNSVGDKTLTAIWEAIRYSIKYELDGGANHADNPAIYTIEDLVVLKAPTKRGYDFAGWQEGGVIAKGSTGDKTFTAQWTVIVYRITYELNGGVNHPANDTVYTVEDSIAIKAPSKTGYNFVGWQGSDTIIVNSVGDKTLTATWEAIRYSIKYELDGGANHADNPVIYTIEDLVVLKAPTKAGYDFTGWDGDITTIVKGSTGDRTFTAQWKVIVYKIAYELNGGVNHPANDTVYTIEDSIAIKAPSKTGYDFVGWQGGDTIIVGSTGDKSFTAAWEVIAYAISYELNGGDNHSDNPAAYTVENSITLKAPSKTGYDFTGWTEGNTIAKGSVGDRNFTAAWKAIAYSITYELDGGINHSDNPATYTIEDYVVPKAPAKDGFIFESWVGDSVIVAGSTGDKTFTALWKCVEANIEEIIIDDVEVDLSDSPNDSIINVVAQECEETAVSLDLGASPQASVTINGSKYTSGTRIPLQQGNVTTVNIQVESETGDSVKNYQLNIAAPITVSSMYYQRWSDVIAVNRNPATNGGYNVSDVRWYKDGEQVSGGSFIVVSSNESAADYHSEVKTENTNAWHRVCATLETKMPEKITAYPNPVSRGEKVSVQLPDTYVGSELNIYDIKGLLVKSGLTLPATSNSIDVSELAPGIYLLHINNRKGNIEVLKMIVE